MSTLTVTAKGQVTLRKDVLEHLGVHPGEKITVNKLPDGKIESEGCPADRQDFRCIRPPEREKVGHRCRLRR